MSHFIIIEILISNIPLLNFSVIFFSNETYLRAVEASQVFSTGNVSGIRSPLNSSPYASCCNGSLTIVKSIFFRAFSMIKISVSGRLDSCTCS